MQRQGMSRQDELTSSFVPKCHPSTASSPRETPGREDDNLFEPPLILSQDQKRREIKVFIFTIVASIPTLICFSKEFPGASLSLPLPPGQGLVLQMCYSVFPFGGV